MSLEEALKKKVVQLLGPHLPRNVRDVSLTRLVGDASTREYFRLQIDSGSKIPSKIPSAAPPTFIIMKMAAGASSVSEEITKSDKEIDEIPFINVQKYLQSVGIPVPQILAYSPRDGFLVLEDLGDRTLEKTVAVAAKEDRLLWYRQAIVLLNRLQEKTLGAVSPDCIATHRKYGREILIWELNHFWEYGLEDRFHLKASAGDRKIFDRQVDQIGSEIIQMPTGFVHRDFQSRNIMVCDDGFFLIDFQDALTGPLLYDLVALLRDSYIDFSEGERERLQQEYVTGLSTNHPYFQDSSRVRRDFDLITLQRKLKDAGRFQYINTVKKNPNFLKHVPQSLKYVRLALERLPEFSELRRILEKYLPEFQGVSSIQP